MFNPILEGFLDDPEDKVLDDALANHDVDLAAPDEDDEELNLTNDEIASATTDDLNDVEDHEGDVSEDEIEEIEDSEEDEYSDEEDLYDFEEDNDEDSEEELLDAEAMQAAVDDLDPAIADDDFLEAEVNRLNAEIIQEANKY